MYVKIYTFLGTIWNCHNGTPILFFHFWSIKFDGLKYFSFCLRKDYFVFDEYKNVFICPEKEELTLYGKYEARSNIQLNKIIQPHQILQLVIFNAYNMFHMLR